MDSAKMNKDSCYAFYGSLRQGMENYHAYQDDLRYIATTELSGFKMYSLSEYPYVVRTGDPDHKIIVDLFRITNESTEQNIHQMEIDAGYIFSEVSISDTKFGIYLFETPGPSDPEVRGGDWTGFRKSAHF